ncbi:S1 domain-containing RNA-binding protein [Hathewaya limosa]|uniref:S1 RNA binding domain protein n=1 Tax=Hathewaya limosa TaxID=1536 RepID=A0ABU0JNB6_HATLI|nr:S1 domain-containing RNA-binding protein [Hathewaya limosa]AWZ49589.1 RNA-binding protein S1 [Clostridiaceae bacterium 14S0207]MDQ0478577.1 S1 RNA binding domain protein [Hathewaya limosa]
MSLQPGNILEGKVVNITKFGAFVEVEGKIGLLHISEISKTFVKDISKHLKENDVVKVKVISVDNDGKISLSMKQLEENKPKRTHVPQEIDWEKEKNKAHHHNFEDNLSKFLKESEERLKDTKSYKLAKGQGSIKKKTK